MPTHKHSRFRLADLAVAVLVGTAPPVTGVLVMNYQLDKHLKEDTAVAVKDALVDVDRFIDGLHTAAMQAHPLLDQPCKAVQDTLQSLTQRYPRISSLTLVKHGSAYCSSLQMLPLHTPVFAADARLQLNLRPQNTPNGILIEYRPIIGTRTVVASAYGVQVRNELRGFREGLVVLMEIGDLYLWAWGDSRDQDRPSHSEYFYVATSEKYGYSIKAGYPTGFTADEHKKSRATLMPYLALIGGLTSVFVFWNLCGRRSRTKRSTAGR